MLAATSLGAIWTAVSPDTGVHAVLERLKQIEPKLLLCDNAARHATCVVYQTDNNQIQWPDARRFNQGA
jgi:acyl-coenzyme A synthetase/AMP-(fatty) acid ligase